MLSIGPSVGSPPRGAASRFVSALTAAVPHQNVKRALRPMVRPWIHSMVFR